MVLALDQLPNFTKGELTFGTVKKFQYEKTLSDELCNGFTKENAIRLYEAMLYNRFFEEMIISLQTGECVPYKGYQFIGATHLSIGQEAIGAGTASAIRKSDYITSTHRGHGHGIAKGLYAILESSEAELRQFISEVDLKSDKQSLIDQAIDVHIYRTMAEFLGKEDGYCRGRGGGMHIADFRAGHLGANAIVGGSLGIAAGAGLSMMLQNKDNVVVCFHGDGAANNGIWHEALNMASMAQFRDKGVPVIFVIENNLYGMTSQGWGEVTGIDYLARRGFAYAQDGMSAEVVNGMDVLAVRDAISRAVQLCRNGRRGPVLLEMLTYRFKGHSLSDAQKYRSKNEVNFWKEQDAIRKFESDLIKRGLFTEQTLECFKSAILKSVRNLTIAAANSKDPKPETIYFGLYSDSNSDQVSEENHSTDFNSSLVRDRRDNAGNLSFRHAINEALVEEMIRDKRVILYGEDVAEHGGAFAVTNDLHAIFGSRRVFNTAISESAIIGSAVGMAMTGLRPVVELMYIDFILVAMDQIGNQAAKNKYMFGGHAVIPMVVRTTTGGGKGYAGQHSQSLEAILTHIPGLKVVAPSTSHDAKGLLKAAIRDDNPVFFIEHQLLYNTKSQVPKNDFVLPLGKADIKREGQHVTIIAYSYMVTIALEAAQVLESAGISAEVVDLMSLVPLDIDTVLKSVKKTGRCLVLNQAVRTGCFGEHISCLVQEQLFDQLKGPVAVVGALEVPPPMSPTLEAIHIPDKNRVVFEVKKMLNVA